MKSTFLKLPEEKVIETGVPICEGGTDLLIKKLLDDKHHGYLRIEADPYLGFALFKYGEIQTGYLLRDNKIVSTSVKALIDFRLLCEREGKITVVRLDDKYFDAATMMHCGEALIAPTDAAVVNFKAIFGNYKDKIKKGLLVLNTPDGNVALIRIEDYKWKLNMAKVKFDEMFAATGAVIALYNYDPSVIDNVREEKEAINPETLLKRELIRLLEEKYGEDVTALVEKISHEPVNGGNLDNVLKEVEEFIKFFIDDRGVKKFITNLKKQLAQLQANE